LLLQLRDERNRLTSELQHQRTLADLGHLRRTLDDAAAAYDAVSGALIDHATALTMRAEGTSSTKGVPQDEWVSQQGLLLSDGYRAMNVQRRRLEIRLPPDNETWMAYVRLFAVTHQRTGLQFVNENQWTPALKAADDGLQLQMEVLHGAFAEAARREVGLAENKP